jgi:TonB family protein
MVESWEPLEPRSERSGVSAALSLALHGGLVWLAISLSGHAAPIAPAAVRLTEIEVVDPPAKPEARGVVARAGTSSPSGVPGRRTKDAAPRSAARSPANPFADLAIRIDAPAGAELGAAGTSGAGQGTGRLGDGFGAGGSGDGFGSLGVPPAPPSLAQAPRPRHDYHAWDFRAPPALVGKTVLVHLAIDLHGAVRAVRVIHGVDPAIDQHAIDTARHFEFLPALSSTGEPTWGDYNWEFTIAGEPNARPPDPR